MLVGVSIKENIQNAQFDFSVINYEIDRYIIDKTSDTTEETYVLFPNHTFNAVWYDQFSSISFYKS